MSLVIKIKTRSNSSSRNHLHSKFHRVTSDSEITEINTFYKSLTNNKQIEK